MATLLDLSPPAPATIRTGDVTRMTRLQKLAVLLIILGPESAPQILETLEAHELEAVSTEMARLPAITGETCAAVLNELIGREPDAA